MQALSVQAHRANRPEAVAFLCLFNTLGAPHTLSQEQNVIPDFGIVRNSSNSTCALSGLPCFSKRVKKHLASNQVGAIGNKQQIIHLHLTVIHQAWFKRHRRFGASTET